LIVLIHYRPSNAGTVGRAENVGRSIGRVRMPRPIRKVLMKYDPMADRAIKSDVFYAMYRSRYEQEFVEITTPRDRALQREAIERENKFKETVRQLWERIRLK
jgi:hypothetical protein